MHLLDDKFDNQIAKKSEPTEDGTWPATMVYGCGGRMENKYVDRQIVMEKHSTVKDIQEKKLKKKNQLIRAK